MEWLYAAQVQLSILQKNMSELSSNKNKAKYNKAQIYAYNSGDVFVDEYSKDLYTCRPL